MAASAAAIRGALDALDADDTDLARRLWVSVDGADLLHRWDEEGRELARRMYSMASSIAEVDHTVRDVPAARPLSTAIFQRDGYRCRYCGIHVFTQWRGGDIPRLVAAMPDLTPSLTVENSTLIGTGKGGRIRNVDAAKWLWCTASADHVVARSHGGRTSHENLVTACAGCNYGKAGRSLAEIAVQDPRGLT